MGLRQLGTSRGTVDRPRLCQVGSAVPRRQARRVGGSVVPGVGRTLSGSCALPGCCPGRTRTSHPATVQTSLSRYVTFELPEQAPPCSTPVRRVACRELVDATQKIGSPSLIGPIPPPTDPVPDGGLGARTRPRPDWTGLEPPWRRRWSVLGPHDTGTWWPSPGTSGHDGYGETAGPSSFAARTTAAGVLRGGFDSHLPPDAEHPAPTLSSLPIVLSVTPSGSRGGVIVR
jgi:hypothetical protein